MLRSVPARVEVAGERWASVDEVAAHIGVRKDSIYRWIEHRGLPARKIGKLWKLKLSEVDAWVQGGGGDDEPGGPPPVVLVVDDDEAVRQVLCEALSDQGYQPLAAGDGAEALALLRSPDQAPPGLILLDLQMPNVDGFEFLKEQAGDPQIAGIPVIIITAERRPELAQAPVLRKPLDLVRLVDAVRATIG